MISIYNKNNDNTFQEATIKENNLELTLTLETADEDKKNITINYDKIKPNLKYAVLYLAQGYSPFIVNEQYDIYASDYAAVFIFKSSSGDIHIQFNIPTNINKDSCKYNDDDEYPNNFRLKMMSLYNDYKEYENKLFYHNAFIDAINNKVSLSYIDAQMELITSLLFDILEKNPELIKNINLDKIKNALDETSLSKIKDDEKILDEIKTSKKYIRSLQKKYYDLRNRI